MKFREIIPYTRMPSYQVNIFIDYLPSWIKRQTEERHLQLNSDFQRGHVWTKEQQISFVEFTLRGGKSGNALYFNDANGFLRQRRGAPNFVCVDGLQRITAVLDFFKDKVPAFGHLCSEYEGRIPIDFSFRVYINDLKTKAEVLTWYLEMNYAGTPHSQEELERVRQLLKAETDASRQ